MSVAPSARGHLSQGIRSSILSAASAAVGSGLRVPLTISAVGLGGYGVVSTIGSLFGWVGFIYAGARVSGAAVASEQADATPPRIAVVVSRATIRVVRPLLVLLALLVIALPLRSLVDPAGVMPLWLLRVVLLCSMLLSLVSIRGSAYLGATTALGEFRTQNLAIVAGTAVGVALSLLAWGLHWPAAAFAVIWLLALAVPVLPASAWLATRRALASARSNIDDEHVRSVSSSGLWISAGQLLASGFDLVIVTTMLGSAAAGELALVTRLMLLTTTPVIGAVPVIMKHAGRARLLGAPHARQTLRKVTAASAAVQALGIVAFTFLCPWACRLLSGGAVDPSAGLVLAAAGWAVVEATRRIAMGWTSHPFGLRVWRRVSLVGVLPNLGLSIFLTSAWGTPGPLVGTVAVSLVGAVAAIAIMRRCAPAGAGR